MRVTAAGLRLRVAPAPIATKFVSLMCSAKVLAGIGDFSATLRDRAVVGVMQRRQTSQPVTRFIYRTASQRASTLKARIEAWCVYNQDRIRVAYETGHSVQFLSDREEENWSPLFSVLTVADPSRFDELRTCAE